MARMLIVLFMVSSCVVLSTPVQGNQYISNQSIIRKLLHYQAPPPQPACFELTGKETQIAGLNAYVSGCPDSRKAIVFASDIFGYAIQKLRMIADKAAQAGFYAVVPDFFNGTAYNGDKEHYFDWRQAHNASIIAQLAQPIVKTLKSDLNMDSIGAAGFCFGAKIATELAKTDEVKGLVLLHPTDVDAVTDIGRVVQPIKIIAAVDDKYCNTTTVKNFADVLDSKVPKLDHGVYSLPSGPQHGWTTKYNCSDQRAVGWAEEAHRLMLDWFLTYV